MSFDSAVHKTLMIERGYANNPNDRGGATRYGITEAKARQYGYKGPMQNLPLKLALHIYRVEYWDAADLDAIDAISTPLAEKLFDVGVNMGPGEAGTFLQRALNAMNDEGKWYKDLKVDGILGPHTVDALKSFLAHYARLNPLPVLLRAINALQGAFYIDISEKRPADEEFVFGWFNKRVQ